MTKEYIVATISVAGERVVDVFDKVALPYKRDNTGFVRVQNDSHCSFSLEPTAEAKPYYSMTTEGNQLILLADNTVVHS